MRKLQLTIIALMLIAAVVFNWMQPRGEYWGNYVGDEPEYEYSPPARDNGND